MTFPDLLTFLASNPLKSAAGAAAGWGLKSLFNTLLTKLLDRRTERLKDDRSAVEREKDREHEGKKWKHEKALALINAPARSISSSVMAVA